MIGLDTAKSVFQIHGVNATGKVELKRKLRRSELIAFFEKRQRCTVVMEACGAAHHWARLLSGLGHTVKLLAPEAVKPFVTKGKKNDAADAAAICEAAARPNVKFVPVKTVEQQGILALHTARALLVKQQTMLANAIRGWPPSLVTWFPRAGTTLRHSLRSSTTTKPCRRRRVRRWPNCISALASWPQASSRVKPRSSSTRAPTRRRVVWRRSPGSDRSPPR
jgi:transposase